MTLRDIEYYPAINDTDEAKVDELMDSIEANGFAGCPILVYGESLLTGSHRLEALKRLAENNDEVWSWDVAEDVTDIVDANIAAREEEDGWAPDIAYDDIGWLLKGSWVENYKDEITEW